MPVQLKDSDFSEILMKTAVEKGKGRLPSPSDDFATDVSTAAPSPEASPVLGPEWKTPLLSRELFLGELDALELPDAASFPDEDFYGENGIDFQMVGLDDAKEDEDYCSTACEAPSHQSSILDEASDNDEDIEGDLLDILHELTTLRADSRQQLQVPECRWQKVPYPSLESGFLPTQLMLTKSWMIQPGHAETGQWAYAMAPRPCDISMEPLNICLGPGGATLEVACGWSEECWADAEEKSASKAKEVIRRRRGRSRSPAMLVLEGLQASSARGRSR
jgi:hypothetical protein